MTRLQSKPGVKTLSGARSSCAIVFGVYERILRTCGIYVSNCNERRHSNKAMTLRKFYQPETKQSAMKSMHPIILRWLPQLCSFPHLKERVRRQRERRPHRCAEGRKYPPAARKCVGGRPGGCMARPPAKIATNW